VRDEALLLDLLIEWAPEETTRRRILVDNPATLYGF
jgi:predicted TIM-barrel fold metal-dependent hydrolase